VKHRIFLVLSMACTIVTSLSAANAVEMTPSVLSSLYGKSKAEIDAMIGPPSQKSGHPRACTSGMIERQEISCMYGAADVAVTYRSGIARSIQWQPLDLKRKVSSSDFRFLSGCKTWSKQEWDETFDCDNAIRLRIDYTSDGTGQVDIFGGG